MKTITINRVKINIIWEQFFSNLFNYTFALGVNQTDKNEMILFHVYGWQGKDEYSVISLFYLDTVDNNANLLTEYVKKRYCKIFEKVLDKSCAEWYTYYRTNRKDGKKCINSIQD